MADTRSFEEEAESLSEFDSYNSFEIIRDPSCASISEDQSDLAVEIPSQIISKKTSVTAFVDDDSEHRDHFVSHIPTTTTSLLSATSTVLTLNALQQHSNNDLLDIISDHETPSASEQEDATNLRNTNADEDLLGECLQTSLESLKYQKQEQAVLKDLIDKKMPKPHNKRFYAPHNTSRSNEVSQTKTRRARSKIDHRIQEQQLSALDKSLRTFDELLASFEARFSSFPAKTLTSAFLGFVCGMVILSAYALIFSSVQAGEIEQFANVSRGEKMEKEKYQKKCEEYRESILHRSEEKVQETSDILQKCQYDLNLSEMKYTQLSNAVKSTQAKLDSVVKIANDLRQKNQDLHDELYRIRAMKDRYDYSVLGGLLICLIIMMALIVPKN